MAKQAGKKKEGQKADGWEGLPPLNQNGAGIDVGSAVHYAAVPGGGIGSQCKGSAVSPRTYTGWHSG